MRRFYNSGATLHPDLTLRCVIREENGLRLSFENTYSGKVINMSCDTLVYENGTLPVDDLYFELMERPLILVFQISGFDKGRTSAQSQFSGFELYRIGDATSSRDVHAAILDAARLCSWM